MDRDRVVNSSDPDQPLLYVLRNIGLTAAKFGCGLGQCGACSVLIDGRSERSCVMTIAAAEGRAITTLEGLGSAAKPSAIQSAFINENVPQCGYCTSGMIVSATALLSSNPKPTRSAGQRRARRQSVPLRQPPARGARGDGRFRSGRVRGLS